MTQSRPITRRCVGAFLPAVCLLAAAGHRSLAAAPNDSAPPAEPANEVTLRGRVLLPDGKPAAGAELYWLQLKSAAPPAQSELWWEKRAVTDDDGRFQWTLEKTDAKLGPSNRPPLIAYKPGLGLDGVTDGRDEVNKEITLRLAENCPIRGRLTDTEGRPVQGAKIVVGSIESASDGSLDRLLEKWKRSPQQLQGRPERILPLYRPFAPLAVEIDGEGRFTVSGVGSDRVVLLAIAAPGYMSDELRVVTRQGFDPADYNEAMAANASPSMRMAGRLPKFVGPVFEHIMEAELVIRGVVFTGRDRKPVALAKVSSATGALQQSLGAAPTTDATGRFELHGVRRGRNVPLSIYPPGNLLSRSLRLDVAPGQTVVDVDVELKEGIVVEGRVFDRATGRGVKSGGLHFAPLPGNHFVDQAGYDGSKNMTSMLSTNEEGRFRLLVVPGPGVLTVQAQGPGPQIDGKRINPYRQASFTEEDSQRVPVTVDGDDRHFTKFNNTLVFLGSQNADR